MKELQARRDELSDRIAALAGMRLEGNLETIRQQDLIKAREEFAEVMVEMRRLNR